MNCLDYELLAILQNLPQSHVLLPGDDLIFQKILHSVTSDISANVHKTLQIVVKTVES